MAGIIEALAGQATNAIAKAFLISGIAPASTLLLGWRVYEVGPNGLRADIVAAFNADISGLTANGVVLLLALAVTAALFYAARTAVLRGLQSPPTAPLRKYLTHVQVARYWAADAHVRELERRLTPLSLMIDGPPTLGSATTTGPALEHACEVSAAARNHLQALIVSAKNGVVELDSAATSGVEAGLRALYEANWPLSETSAWRGLLQDLDAREVLTRIHADIFRLLHSAKTRQQELPDDERWLKPTRLGNLSSALDDYCERRYGLSTSALWLRLWSILSDTERADVAASQLAVEGMANQTAAFLLLCAGIAATAASAAIQGYAVGAVPGLEWRSVGFLLGYAGLAVGAYRSCVFAFGAVGERVMRLVDLHRLRLIATLGYPSPKSVADELRTFAMLRKFFDGAENDPSSLRPPGWPLEVPKPRSSTSEKSTQTE